MTSTTTQLGGALGVAALGCTYLASAATTTARHAFALTTLTLGAVALGVAVPAYLATHLTTLSEPSRSRDPVGSVRSSVRRRPRAPGTAET